jgi:hypothetical protein
MQPDPTRETPAAVTDWRRGDLDQDNLRGGTRPKNVAGFAGWVKGVARFRASAGARHGSSR